MAPRSVARAKSVDPWGKQTGKSRTGPSTDLSRPLSSRWRKPTSAPVFPRWMTSAAIYAISATLAGGALALLAYGPLHDAAPLRQPIPQPAMFAVVCILFGATLWAPVSLHYRGNTIAFALDPIPILLGLVFLRPALLVLSAVCAETFVCATVRKLPLIKVVLNVALFGFSTAVSASSTVSCSERTALSACAAGPPQPSPCVPQRRRTSSQCGSSRPSTARPPSAGLVPS